MNYLENFSRNFDFSYLFYDTPIAGGGYYLLGTIKRDTDYGEHSYEHESINRRVHQEIRYDTTIEETYVPHPSRSEKKVITIPVSSIAPKIRELVDRGTAMLVTLLLRIKFHQLNINPCRNEWLD